MQDQSSRRERLERLVFVAAAAFLILVAGMLLARYKKFPYSLLDDAIKGAGAVAVQLGIIADTDSGTVVSDGERSATTSGVAFYDAALSAGGYTLFTAGSGQEASLIDMAGRTVHRWSLPESAIREHVGRSDALPDADSFPWRSFHMYPNGDLLVVLQGGHVTPYGLGIFKIDRNSKLLWANLEHAHHDVTVDEDGLIYTISQEIRKKPVEGLDVFDPPFIEDFVLVLSPNGQPVHRISVMEAFSGTPYAAAASSLGKSRDLKGDYFHVNAIEPYDSRNEIPVLHANQVLISIRDMDSLAVLDLESGKIVWLLRGSWHRQHDPDITDGHIMLFDNRGDFSRGARSRVLEFDPVTGQITWQAGAEKHVDLFSGWGAGQQPLENGNVLINESVPARILEITRDGRLAWEFYGAQRDDSGKYAAPILEARRYSADYIEFELDGE